MTKNWVLVVIALLALLGARLLGASLQEQRVECGISDLARSEELTPGEFLGTVAAGPIRAVPTAFLLAGGMDAFQRQDWHHALAIYDLLVQLQPRLPAVWMQNGWNMIVNVAHHSFEAGEPDQAYEWVLAGLDHIRRGAERNPTNAEIRFYYGRMLFRVGRKDILKKEVVDYYQRRFGDDDRDPLQESLTHFDLAAKINPNFAGHHEMQGRVRIQLAHRELKNGDPERSVELLRESIPPLLEAQKIVTRVMESEEIPEENKAAFVGFNNNLAAQVDFAEKMINDIMAREERVEPSDSH